jgi:hypothetical protein
MWSVAVRLLTNARAAQMPRAIVIITAVDVMRYSNDVTDEPAITTTGAPSAHAHQLTGRDLPDCRMFRSVYCLS